MIDLSQIKSGDFLECNDGSSFIVRNGKLFGPTAWMYGGMGSWYVTYQAGTLGAVVDEVNRKHGIYKIISGRLKVIMRIILFSIGFR